MQLMKKIILSSMLFAAAAMAFVSCQKSETTPTPESKLVTLKFTSANPTTKTEYNGETIVWSAGDKIRMACTKNGEWQHKEGDEGARLYVAGVLDESLDNPSETATFSLADYFSGIDVEGPYQFYTMYPNTAKSGTTFTAPNAEVTIATAQTSTSTTFDKGADLLWGKAVNVWDHLPSRDSETIPLMWTRLVAHAYITLDGFTEGEELVSVTLTAQEGAALTGSYNLNITNGEFAPNAASNTVTIIGNEIYADAEGKISVWACVNPCTITSLDIEVVTDLSKYTISKTGFSREFLQNRRNLLSIGMSGANKEAVVQPATFEGYTQITSLKKITTGEYIIATNAGNGTYYAAATNIRSNGLDNIPVTLSDNVFTLEETEKNYVFNITRTGDQISIAANNQYLTGTKGGTKVQWLEAEFKWNLISTAELPIILQSSADSGRALKFDTDGSALNFKGYTHPSGNTRYTYVMLFKKN